MTPYMCAAFVLTNKRLTPKEQALGKEAIRIATPNGKKIIQQYVDMINTKDVNWPYPDGAQ